MRKSTKNLSVGLQQDRCIFVWRFVDKSIVISFLTLRHWQYSAKYFSQRISKSTKNGFLQFEWCKQRRPLNLVSRWDSNFAVYFSIACFVCCMHRLLQWIYTDSVHKLWAITTQNWNNREKKDDISYQDIEEMWKTQRDIQ